MTAAPGVTRRRTRPSAWWFLGPLAVFLVTAAITGVLVVSLLGLTRTDARVRLDGQPQLVEVPTDRDRMIWVDQDVATPACEVRERDGTALPLERVTQRSTRDAGRGPESGRWRFDPGDGVLVVRCTAHQAEIGFASVGPAITLRMMLTEFAPWFLLAMLLSGVWIGWLVVLLVRTAKGPDRLAPPPPPWTRPV